MKGRSGGARPGSGPKPMSARERAIRGAKDQRKSPPPLVEPVPVQAPPTLTSEERVIWDWLAPHAVAAGTLTPAGAYGFSLLCRNVVIERELAADPATRGQSNHRGVVQRIDAELARYMLAPMGKPLVEPAAEPEDEWAQFDVIQGGKA